MPQRIRNLAVPLGLVIAGAFVCSGCAHRREAFYPNQRGVHVRAPFVNIDVPAGPRVHVDATGTQRGRPVSQARRLSEPPLLTGGDWESSSN